MTAPSPTPEDLKRWRKLCVLAREALDGALSTEPTGFRAHILTCRRKTTAPGILTVSNPFVQLVRLCDRWVQATTAKRRDLLVDLLVAVVAVEQALDALTGDRPDGAPARRERKDIDG